MAKKCNQDLEMCLRYWQKTRRRIYFRIFLPSNCYQSSKLAFFLLIWFPVFPHLLLSLLHLLARDAAPRIFDFLFFSLQQRCEGGNCYMYKNRNRGEWNFEVHIHAITLLVSQHTLSFRLSTFIKIHYSYKKDPPPTLKITKNGGLPH